MDSVSRLSSMVETARDLTVEAAQSAGSVRALSSRATTKELSFTQIKKLLESRFDREVLDGLRRVISMVYRSQPCLPYFSAVVKNVASPNVEIKKLVYIYILHHAESEPDLALLSINAIQKSLSDQNPQVRAMALRVMSGIRVPVISQIVSLAIKKGCGDMSPHVRKSAALAIPKCYKLDPSTLPQLYDYLSTLLGDRQYFVVGSAVTAFLEVCPERIDLIHRHYRSLVKKLIDMDEWGQLALIKLMTFYARKCFPRRTGSKKGKSKENFHDKEKREQPETIADEVEKLDPDLELFLQSSKPLLSSRNAAVVIAVARAFLNLGTPAYIDLTARPLVALLRSSHSLHGLIFYNVVGVCIARPKAFVPYLSRFLVKTTDSTNVSRLKLELLTLLFPYGEESEKGIILSELEHFTKSENKELVRESVRAIGRCSENDLATSKRCMNLLLEQATSKDDILVAEALTVVRHFIQRDASAHYKTVVRLAKNLDSMVNPEARACVIWLIGEFAGVDEKDDIAPDVLRILLQGFADEAEVTKLQIVLLAAKVYLHYLNRQAAPPNEVGAKIIDEQQKRTEELESEASKELQPKQESQPEHPVVALWHYLLLLVRYDVSYDLRDRTRMYKALLENPSSTQLANLMLLAPKPAPHVPSPSEGRQDFLLGSASLAMGPELGASGLQGYEPLPDWVKEGDEPDPGLRDETQLRNDAHGFKARPTVETIDPTWSHEDEAEAINTGGNKNKTLDDWLAEDEEEEEDVEEESEDEEGEEEYSDEYETETDEEESEVDEKAGEGRILLR